MGTISNNNKNLSWSRNSKEMINTLLKRDIYIIAFTYLLMWGRSLLFEWVCWVTCACLPCIKHTPNRLQFPVLVCLKWNKNLRVPCKAIWDTNSKILFSPILLWLCFPHLIDSIFTNTLPLLSLFSDSTKFNKNNSLHIYILIVFHNWLSHMITITNTNGINRFGKVTDFR